MSSASLGHALPPLSIIIPTLNEADNIAPLLKRIESTLKHFIQYEIIFVDDHSTDKTVSTIQKLAQKQSGPAILIHKKVGIPGKAFSLLEGFELAKYELICTLDADLQYPPEFIPRMLVTLENGYDIIVADRENPETSFLRRQLSLFGKKLYGQWLHGLDCDVQSGLKLFRKSILDRTTIDATKWTFDIVFLLQARAAKQRIGTIKVPFAKRVAGDSKISIFRDGFEIMYEALKFRFGKTQTVRYTETIAFKKNTSRKQAELTSNHRPSSSD